MLRNEYKDAATSMIYLIINVTAPFFYVLDNGSKLTVYHLNIFQIFTYIFSVFLKLF